MASSVTRPVSPIVFQEETFGEKLDTYCSTFGEKLDTYCSTFVTLSETGSYFEWPTIYAFASQNMRDFLERGNAHIFSSYMLKLLGEFDCDDEYLITIIIDLYYSFLNPFAVSESSVRHRSYENLQSTIVGLFLFKREYTSIFPHDAKTLLAINSGDVGFMHVLARYGICYLSLREGYPFHMNDADSILMRFICYLEWLRREEENEAGSIHFIKEKAVEYINFLCGRGQFRESSILPTSDSTRRKYHSDLRKSFKILKLLDSISLKMLQLEGFCDYVKCLKVYFDTDPESLITVTEMKEFLKDVIERLKLRSVEYIRDFVDEDIRSLCEIFIEMFPDSNTSHVEPRTLEHLCRCRIREILLGQNGSLPVLVSKLPVQGSFKRYILCESGEAGEIFS